MPPFFWKPRVVDDKCVDPCQFTIDPLGQSAKQLRFVPARHNDRLLQSLPHLAGLPRYTVTVETAPVVG